MELLEEKSIIEWKLKSDEFTNFMKDMKVNSVLLFGSILSDEFHDESDVDIAVLSKNKITLKEILGMELFLEKLLNRRIDVIDLKNPSLDIFIKVNILNTGKSIYTSDENIELYRFINEIEWYYRENERYYQCRKRELLS